MAQQVSELELDVRYHPRYNDVNTDDGIRYTGDINRVAAMLASLVAACSEHLKTASIRFNGPNTAFLDMEPLMVRAYCSPVVSCRPGSCPAD